MSVIGLSTGAAAHAPRHDDAGPAARCAHCGLDVPAGLFDPGAEQQFCCHGCRTVFAVLHEHGLDQYYRLREATGATGQPAVVSDNKFSVFDEPEFESVHVRALPNDSCTTELYVEGVHCAACAWLIERLPHLVPGVREAHLNLRRRVVRVTWSPEHAKLSAIARQLDRLGYTPHPARDAGVHVQQREQRRLLVHIAVAGAIAGNTMLLAFALYGGMFHGMEAPYRLAFRLTSMALAGTALAWPGRTFFRAAAASLRAGRLHMDVPIVIGLSAAMLWSVTATLRDTGEVYYDCIAMLVFLLLIGRWIQLRQLRASVDTVQMLFAMTPNTARRVRDGAVRDVPTEAIERGDELEVRPGDTVPVDGMVLRGASDLDESLLTGESIPRLVQEHDAVRAGTLNLRSPLRIRADATGGDTRLGRLMALVEQCAEARTPIVQLADRLSGVFVVCVLTLAAVTAAAWWRFDPAGGIEHALAVLIITCPCALGLATPLAIVAGIGRAAQHGILIKGGAILELLCQPRRMLLDKTGTLTEGRMRVVRWTGDRDALAAAAALEACSTHPVARAMAALGQDQPATVAAVTHTPGAGMCGTVNGRSVIVGSTRFVEASTDVSPNWCIAACESMLAEGLSPVLVAIDGTVTAVAGVGDALRPEARQALDTLQQRGWTIEIVSGDHDAVVQRVAAALDIPADRAHGSMTPEQKLELVTQLERTEPTVMVGDGANDAAALAVASAGIAVRGGVEASLLASDVYLARGGLMALIDLIDGAQRTRRIIVRNLGISLAYNVVGASLAMAGLINPIIAAVLMPVSSLTVVALSARSRTFSTTAPAETGAGRTAVQSGVSPSSIA